MKTLFKRLLLLGAFATALTPLWALASKDGSSRSDHHHSTEQAACSLPSLHCAQAPSAAFAVNGRLWVAWAFGGHVYVNYSDDQGGQFSAPVAVNRVPEAISAGAENRPKIQVDGQGRVHLSWTKPLAKRFTGDIRYSRSDDGGQSFIDPVTVNDNRDQIGHRFDALGVSAEGHVYIAWLDKRDRERAAQQGIGYPGAALYYTHAAPGSDQFAANIKIADNSCECCRIALDIDPDGLPVMLWRHVYGDNIRDHALVHFLAPDTAGTPVRVSHDQWKIDACPHHGPTLSINTDGRYHAVWFNDAEERKGLFYAHSADAGQHFSAPVSVGRYDRRASHPSVLAVADKVYLSWKEFDGRETQILLQQSDDAGQSWGIPIVLASTSGASDYPLLMKHGSRVFLAWQTAVEGFRVLPVLQGGK